ncbi:MAG: rhomboid family intramembrane serine protease, partial [Pseudomonadota bacterium]
FTATLIHADFGHLLSNSYMLLIFSYFVYGYFGSIAFPFGSFILAGLVNVLTVLTMPPETGLLGASGLVYLLGGFWLTSYFFIQRQHTLLPRLIRVLGIALMVFFPTTFVPTTSYMAHAIGFAVGSVFAVTFFAYKKKWIRSFERKKFSMIPVEVAEGTAPSLQ